MPESKDHMIELIDGLKAQHKRRIAVLLQHDRRKEGSLQAMSRAVPHHTSEAPECGAPAGLGVVREVVEKLLDGERCTEPVDEPSLLCRKRETWSRLQ